jgi:hypothetical protein
MQESAVKDNRITKLLNEQQQLDQKLSKLQKSEQNLKEKLKEAKIKNEECLKSLADVRKNETTLKSVSSKKESSLLSELKKKDIEIENLKSRINS